MAQPAKVFTAVAAALLGVTLVATRSERAPDETSAPPPAVAAPVAQSAAAPLPASAVLATIKVWKSPSCGCCSGYVDHLRAAGFTVEVEDVADIDAVKREHGVPGHLASCHTALVDGYLVEGHVPAEVIARVLAERPEIAGVAVPGMPIGTPGMEMGSQKDPYDVVAFTADGATRVFESR